MVPFSSFFRPKSSAMHTNGLAKVGNRTSIGASSSAETFGQRQRIDTNRQHIQNYRGAGLHTGYRKESYEALKTVREQTLSSIGASETRGQTSQTYGQVADAAQKTTHPSSRAARYTRLNGSPVGKDSMVRPGSHPASSPSTRSAPASRPPRYNPYT